MPFDGKVIVFKEDFHQVLPTIFELGTKHEQTDACEFDFIPLWPDLIKIRLTANMRAILDPHFSQYLIKIGNSMTTTIIYKEKIIIIPNEMHTEMTLNS